MKLLTAATALLLTCALHGQQVPKPAPSASSNPAAAAPDPGSLSGSVYRNASFGFNCKIPYGWVDRTTQMNEDSAAPAKASVLLAAFERPPGAAADSVNSAIVISAESAASYPGLKSAAQYFGPVGEIAKSQEFTAITEPYEFPVDGKPIVRQDFSKKLGSLTMYQSTLAMLQKGYIVSFTFIGGSADEITGNLDELRFTTVKPARPH